MCVYANRGPANRGVAVVCKMATECSREETLLLLRKTISRLDRLKANHSWSGKDAAIEDIFRDIQRERYAVSFFYVLHDFAN